MFAFPEDVVVVYADISTIESRELALVEEDCDVSGVVSGARGDDHGTRIEPSTVGTIAHFVAQVYRLVCLRNPVVTRAGDTNLEVISAPTSLVSSGATFSIPGCTYKLYVLKETIIPLASYSSYQHEVVATGALTADVGSSVIHLEV